MLAVDADLADLFEVKEGRVALHPAVQITPGTDMLTFRSAAPFDERGMQVGIAQETTVTITPGLLSWAVVVPPRAHWSTSLTVHPVERANSPPARRDPDRVSGPAGGSRPGGWLRRGSKRPTRRSRPPCAPAERTSARCGSSTPTTRSGGGRRGRAVVHGAVRPRLAAHLVDGAAAGPEPRPRHAADAGRTQGTEVDPLTEEEPGRDPARDAVRARGRSWPSGGGTVYYGTVDATPLFVMLLGELQPLGPARPSRERAPARRRPGAGLDRAVRRPRRRRLRRVPARDRPRPGQPGLEGLVRRHQLRRRAGRRAARSRSARCRATSYAAYLARARTRRRRAATTASAERVARPRRHASRPRSTSASGCPTAAGTPSRSTATSGRSTPAPPTWATACGPASSTRTRPPQVAEQLLSPEMFTGWGVRTLASHHGRLQPDELPQRLGLAARQRARRGRPDALRLRRARPSGIAWRRARRGRSAVRRAAARAVLRLRPR